MKKQTLGIVAGAAGAALLLGGGTFALWTDSAEADGGQITAGNLDVAVTGSAWQDISADRPDNPHDIDLKTFKIIPGDTVQGTYGVDVGLEGDNMVAKLKLAGGGQLEGALAEGLSLKYSVQDAAGKEIATGDNAGVEVSLVSSDNTAPGGTQVAAGTVVDGTADFNVVVTAEFAKDTPNRELVQQQAALAGSNIQLQQDR
ncbi:MULTISPECIES: alternate-type signal peptide domain-containing protein [Brevibacterium]|uniref:alternate-type signal peptide domain-containing protein n=1 Tax=Brevibacterium TaxID=1696 RepID=UPI0014309F37|nr:alternate-type signal peptide domain-containing protein [Brevibacterium casei]MCT1447386.1 alternate-type signal peptide domain-containing protein [Brevibacterium casei]QQT68182.1 alternate-type signal peptide domain-containing protein [Brevibacterium casei]